jgi:iron complex transport system ATP-binding protein
VSVQVNNLTIGYQDSKTTKVVAESINLSLKAGELVCLMGPNGIGKSTLLRTLTGMQPTLGGTIKIHDIELTNIKGKALAQSVAVVLTERPAIGLMTVTETVAMGRYPHTDWQDNHKPEDKQFIDQAIQKTGLEERAKDRVMELSDGFAQKTFIARALCQDTPLIILDEPTVHLDVKNKAEIMRLLKKLTAEEQKTILLSTHDLELALAYADKLWLFGEDGIKEGLPEDLFLNGSVFKTFGDLGVPYKTELLSATHSVTLGGAVDLQDMTKKALTKHGIEVLDSAKMQVVVNIDHGNYSWTIDRHDHVFSSLAELIAFIKES